MARMFVFLLFVVGLGLTVSCGGGGGGGGADTVSPSAPQVTGGVAPNAVVSGIILLSAKATDNSGTVRKMEFFYAASPATLACSDSTSKPSGSTFSCSWDTRTATDGAYILTAKATDPSGNSSTSAPIPFTINNQNLPPTITSGPVASPPNINEGQVTNLAVTATDPDNDPLSYQWTQVSPASPVGTFGNANSANTTWTAPQVSGNTVFALQVTVSDGKGGTAQGTVNVPVADVPPLQFTLTVNKAGTGTGTVTSTPSGIDCGTDCTELYNSGAVVNLTATPNAGSSFAGWSGHCSGPSPTVQVTMNTDKTCTATFQALTLPDLRVLHILTSPREAYWGSSVEITFAVSNVGSAAAGSSASQIFLAGNANCSAGPTLQITNHANLNPGQADERTLAMPLPMSGADGDYFVCVRADVNNTVTESNEANNLQSDALSIFIQTPGGPEDIYEPDDIPVDATLIPADGTIQSHRLGSVDWLAFQGTAGTHYLVETLNLSSRADTIISVFDSFGNPVASSDDCVESLRSCAFLTAAASGFYLFAVEAFGDNYDPLHRYDVRVVAGGDATLSGQLGVPGGPTPQSLPDLGAAEVVPGDVIVRFPEDWDLSRVLRFIPFLEKVLGTSLEYHKFDVIPYFHFRASERTVTMVQHLMAWIRAVVPGVIVEPNHILQASAIPNDQFYNLQWHYPMMRLPEAWDINTGNNNVVVAVLDTGQKNHPDIQARQVPGYDFISDPARALDGGGRDPDPTDPGDRREPDGSSTWHGLHVAGTVGAVTNNGAGVAGVMWSGKIQHIRVLGKEGGTDRDILDAILWAAGYAITGVPNNPTPAKVINMSLGGEHSGVCPSSYRDAIRRARARGAVVVVAAGNDRIDASREVPACVPEAITVAALDLAGKRAHYSNFGAAVDVSAPGGDIDADLNNDGYADGVLSTFFNENSGQYNYYFQQGTSMAAPHVAGLAGLIFSVNPSLTVEQVENIIRNTTNPAYQCAEGCGTGLVDAFAALRAASGGGPPTGNPVLSVQPASINFGGYETSAVLLVANSGAGTLTGNIAKSGPGAAAVSLSASSFSVGAGESTAITVTVNRAGLADGNYTATLNIASNGGNASLPVSFAVGAQIPDVGTVYVLLVDPDTLETMAQVETTVAQEYRYSFSGIDSVVPGLYFLVAGTDNDNDSIINDAGEYFGMFPVESDPQVLIVAPGASATGLNFNLALVTGGLGSSASGSAGQRLKSIVRTELLELYLIQPPPK